MNSYDYIKILPNAIPEEFIEFIEPLKNQYSVPALVGSGNSLEPNLEYRNTNWIPIPIDIVENISFAITNLYEKELLETYKKQIKKIEPTQFLHYPVGGKYDIHNDADDVIGGKIVRVHDRDITVLSYLNDDFENGELEFNFLGITIKPQKGMIVAFPSYYEFTHQVHPVTKGDRYTLATWIETNERIYNRN
jgi:hypothetical protein